MLALVAPQHATAASVAIPITKAKNNERRHYDSVSSALERLKEKQINDEYKQRAEMA